MTEPRARIGYTSVAYVTEIFPKLFYELVPEGVLLQILTQHVSSHADGNTKILHESARNGGDLCARRFGYGDSGWLAYKPCQGRERLGRDFK